MKRPTSRRDQNESTGRTVTSDTPLNALIEKLVRLMERPPRPSLEIRNTSRAQREWKIVEVLCSIDLTQSRLPIEILNKKSDPDQSVPDIEMYIFLARNMIRDNEQDYTGINTAYIEACIIEIAKLAKQAVEEGSIRAADAACRGLMITICDIRNRLPQIPDSIRAGCVDVAKELVYLCWWYVRYSFALDEMEKSAADLRERIIEDKERLLAEIKEIADRYLNDPKFKATIARDLKNTSFVFNLEEQRLYCKLVDRRIEESLIELRQTVYDRLTADIGSISGNLDRMVNVLCQQSYPTDAAAKSQYYGAFIAARDYSKDIKAKIKVFLADIEEAARTEAHVTGDMSCSTLTRLKMLEELQSIIEGLKQETAVVGEGNEAL